MKQFSALSVLFLCLFVSVYSSAALELRPIQLNKTDEGVILNVGTELLTHYKIQPDAKYPYFYPVNGPFGKGSVTTETSEPYPHHHSLFFGCDRVNGGNYWQEGVDRGQIVSQKITILNERDHPLTFQDECLWIRPGAEPPFKDTRLIAFHIPYDDPKQPTNIHQWWIDFDITLEALIDVTIEKTNHSLFAARMIPELSVQSGGVLVNAEGAKSEKGTFGKPSPWCDYSGTREGVTEGLAILSHPQNRWFPEPWFTRDYGFFSPTPFNWLEEGKLEIPKGEKIHLRYRVVVHGGNAEQAGIAGVYEKWAAGGK